MRTYATRNIYLAGDCDMLQRIAPTEESSPLFEMESGKNFQLMHAS